MNDAAPAQPARWLYAALLIGAVKVAFLCAAYPLFTNVDEAFHYDTTLKYARGQWPLKFKPIETETARVMWGYSTPAYSRRPERRDPAPGALSAELAAKRAQDPPPLLTTLVSHESAQPPVSYLAGATVYLAAQTLGVPEHARPFAVRLLNVAWVLLLVGGGWRLARALAPGDERVADAVALGLALFPTDCYAYVSNDFVSAVACAWTLALLVPGWLNKEAPPAWPALLGGAACAAAAVLTKWTNLPILLVPAVSALLLIRRDRALGKASALAAVTLTPVALWCARCKSVVGDLFGQAEKVADNSWTPKPFVEWFSHPLFSLEGLNPFQARTGAGLFFFDTCATYWRGDITWFQTMLRHPALDVACYLLTLAGLIGAVLWMRQQEAARQWTGALMLLLCGAFLLQLVVVSIRFDFGTYYFPSPQYPYLATGRLIMGTLPMVLSLLVLGWHTLISKAKPGLDPRLPATLIFGLVAVLDLAISFDPLGSAGSIFNG